MGNAKSAEKKGIGALNWTLLLVIGFYLNRYYLPLMRPTMLNYVLYVLLQTIIIENAMPSGADFRVAGMYLKGILLYGFLLVALLVFM